MTSSSQNRRCVQPVWLFVSSVTSLPIRYPSSLAPCILCRSFLDGSSGASLLEHFAEDELALHLALWPCAWILMEPSRKAPPFQTPRGPIAIPLRIDQVASPFPLELSHPYYLRQPRMGMCSEHCVIYTDM